MSQLLFLGNLGAQEIILIAFVVLLLFGGKKIPELMKGIGKGVRSFKEGINGIEKEINDELDNFNSLTLDFTDLEYISSAGLRVLIATQKKLKSDNIPFVIKNVNATVSEIFRMSGFDKILKIE